MRPDDFELLKPHLRAMSVQLRQVLIRPHGPVLELYFPETAFISVTTDGPDQVVEVGVIGREGLVGATPFLLGSDTTPYAHFVQGGGDVLSIGADALQAAVAASAQLQRLLLRFVQVMMVQVSQTAFVNATYDIESRLARWLLMCQDRMGDDLAVTHEFLSMMLGVQRTSVTLALQILEGSGLIRARRGRIEVRNREQLRIAADNGYGVPEAEYARLIEGQ